MAKRMMRLRRKYSEIMQIAHFETVTAALTNSKKLGETERADPAKEKITPVHLVSADDL